ncbi:MAG: EamA family transporter [Deltaproteobacteria bacterium]|nr:EamA family transporter [Deltaproteobacteria bacterium]
MWSMLWPLLLIVAANCFYNICTKSLPENINTFGALIVTYLMGALLATILFVTSVKPQNIMPEMAKINWTSFVLGMAIVALEAGYVFLYRAGWKVSSGSLIANICLAVVLLAIGPLLYHETISLRQIVGVVICAIGLFLISK